MTNDEIEEKTSLWGVLHDGELTELRSSPLDRTAEIKVVVPHLSDYYGWARTDGIRALFTGTSSLHINQWIPDPGNRSDAIRSRRWSKREWASFELAVPPHSLEILEASLFKGEGSCRMELSGYEHDYDGRTDKWLDLQVKADSVQFMTPDGPCDVDRLIALGDSYWDNFGKKRKR